MFMRMTIPINIKPILQEIHDAKEFINYVKNHFLKIDKSLVRTLMIKLISIKYDGSHSMQEHVLEMINLVEQLKTLEIIIDGFFLVHFTLSLMP